MGTFVTPGEKGPDCVTATPEVWPTGKTPKYLLCNLVGMTGCIHGPETIPDRIVILTQDDLNYCLWKSPFGDDHVRTSIDIDGSHLQAWWEGKQVFMCHTTEKSTEHFNNIMKCLPDLIHDIGGSGYIDKFDYPGRAYQQAHDFNFMPIPWTKFDVYSVPGEPAYVTVRRFANVRTPTNIKIKFDATHYDQWDMFEREP